MANFLLTDFDTDVQNLEQAIAYLLDVYYQLNSLRTVTFRDSGGGTMELPLIFKNEGVITTNGVICDEYFLRIPFKPSQVNGQNQPANDYRWRYADHVNVRIFEQDLPEAFPAGWKTANLSHSA